MESEKKKIEGLTKGRIVHYVPGAQHIASNRTQPPYLAAMIVGVVDRETGACNLIAFKDGSREHVDQVSDSADTVTFRIEKIPHSEDPKTPGTWHWPTRCGCQ